MNTFLSKMENVIQIINKLQSVLTTTNSEIQLPQIVMVGDQSSGKSAVVEGLVNKSFLPRGNGMATRCPIVLQMRNIKEESGLKDWARLVEGSGSYDDDANRIYDFNKVRELIEQKQLELAGDQSSKQISSKEIILEVHSKNVINDLTLVDLPGLVNNPSGNQPGDIKEQITTLVLKYISNPSAIILAVSSATNDFATSESIRLSRTVDPGGERTMAVLTKIDLHLKGKVSDTDEALKGNVLDIKLGIIGIINTSQDFNSENEDKILKSQYPHITEIGSTFLSKRLSRLLFQHIHRCLPDLNKRIFGLTKKCEKDLLNFGQKTPTKPTECVWSIAEATQNFVERFRQLVCNRPVNLEVDKSFFAVGLNQMFEELQKSCSVNENEIDVKKISDLLKNTMNWERLCSIEDVFKSTTKQEIMKMQPHFITFSERVHDLLSSTAKRCFDGNNHSLKTLNIIIQSVVGKLLFEKLEHVKTGIIEEFERQTIMIHSTDVKYVQLLQKGIGITKSIKNNIRSSVSTASNIASELEEAEEAFNAFSITVSPSNDSHCKTSSYVKDLVVTHFKTKKQEMSDRLLNYLMFDLAEKTFRSILGAVKKATEGKEVEMFIEDEGIKKQRTQKQNLYQDLNHAAKILQEVNIINNFK